jgi:hypothetical protein
MPQKEVRDKADKTYFFSLFKYLFIFFCSLLKYLTFLATLFSHPFTFPFFQGFRSLCREHVDIFLFLRS